MKEWMREGGRWEEHFLNEDEVDCFFLLFFFIFGECLGRRWEMGNLD